MHLYLKGWKREARSWKEEEIFSIKGWKLEARSWKKESSQKLFGMESFRKKEATMAFTKEKHR